MTLVLHILCAIASLAASTIAYFRPSSRLLSFSWSLVGATLITGTVLIISQPVHILSVCISGFLYSMGVGLSLRLARQRLATRESVL